jgi:periplasmic copper chaperone A
MKLKSLLAALTMGLLTVANVDATQADHVIAGNAWIRLLPAKLPAAGYVTLQNTSSSDATLVTAHSAVYASVMLHQSGMESGGMSGMHAIDQLRIPARGKATLAPAGYHLMLEQPDHALKPGDQVEITLDFADGSHLPVQFAVRPANAAEPN